MSVSKETKRRGISVPLILVTRDDWHLEDPKSKALETVLMVRDDIRSCVQALLERQGCAAGFIIGHARR